uniref:Nucleic-acid-binding protein n=1 Tax=Sipha flava TaxID=143950 RepID=A0A2S2Q5P5_9HEMI
MFFVDLNPQESDNDIFSITALLHTKVKIEELHKKREIPQCLNCQSYGHTRTYCAYPPKCVKCGDCHPTLSCIKPPELPAKCALCSGPHPANYKGCLIFKQLWQKRPNFSSKIANISSKTTNISSYNSQPQPPYTSSSSEHQSQLNENSSPHPRTYANTTKGPPPNNQSNSTDNETSLTKFLDEFKSIINPLLSLLTQVLTNFINNINK